MALPQLSSEESAEIVRLEEAMWREATRFDLEFQQTRFAEDFLEFGRSGRIYARHEVIRTDAHPIRVTLPLQDLTVRVVDINTVQVTYGRSEELVYRPGVAASARSRLESRQDCG